MTQLRDLAARWRADATVLERRGASEQAAALETCAAELEEHLKQWELEALPVAQAAEESGYSEAQLRRVFPGQRAIARRDLPKKARGTASGPDLALVLGRHS